MKNGTTSTHRGGSYCLFEESHESHAALAASREETLHHLDAAGGFKELAQARPIAEVV